MSASHAAARAAVSKHRAHSNSTWERADPSLGAPLPGSEQVARPKPAALRQGTGGRRLSPLARSSPRASRGPGKGRVAARGSLLTLLWYPERLAVERHHLMQDASELVKHFQVLLFTHTRVIEPRQPGL